MNFLESTYVNGNGSPTWKYVKIYVEELIFRYQIKNMEEKTACTKPCNEFGIRTQIFWDAFLFQAAKEY